MDEELYGQMLYGTLPPDTQDFQSVLRGIGRTLAEKGRAAGQSVIEGGQRAEALQSQAFPDPTRPLQLQNPQALAQLTDMIMNGPMGMAQMGITAYHGSPYLFRMLDPAKRGTGEGAQQYGSGAGYTAAVRDVAESYSPRDYKYEDYLQKLYKQAEQKQDYGSMEVLESAMMHNRPAQLREQYGNAAESIIKKIEQVQPKSYLYKGDIPDDILPKFLDWDKPLKEQSKEVQSLAKQYGLALDDLGGDLVSTIGKTPEGSAIMESAGIRGIKYFDANSRNAKYGSQNFIPFRAEDFKIQEINDIPIEQYFQRGLLDRPMSAKDEAKAAWEANPENRELYDIYRKLRLGE